MAYELNIIDELKVETRKFYKPEKLIDLGLKKQPKIILQIDFLESDRPGYLKIQNVWELDVSFKGNTFRRSIRFQRQNIYTQIKTIKKGAFIEISNKPFYDKTRIFI